MGLFGKKDIVYEKNTEIATLQEQIKVIEERLAKVKLKLADERAENASLRSELEATETDLSRVNGTISTLRRENDALNRELETLKSGGADSRAEYLAKEQAEKLKRTALEKYALELKRIKLFSAKWQAFFVDKPQIEKQELVNLLKDILVDSETVRFILDAKKTAERVGEKLGEPFEPQKKIAEHFDGSESFNIEEATTADDLDLEQLCRELGVFEG